MTMTIQDLSEDEINQLRQEAPHLFLKRVNGIDIIPVQRANWDVGNIPELGEDDLMLSDSEDFPAPPFPARTSSARPGPNNDEPAPTPEPEPSAGIKLDDDLIESEDVGTIPWTPTQREYVEVIQQLVFTVAKRSSWPNPASGANGHHSNWIGAIGWNNVLNRIVFNVKWTGRSYTDGMSWETTAVLDDAVIKDHVRDKYDIRWPFDLRRQPPVSTPLTRAAADDEGPPSKRVRLARLEDDGDE